MCETNNCGICLETLEKTNVCVTSCGHTFCLKCIIKNTNYNNCCPYCRTEIVENTNSNEEDSEEEEEENIEPQYQYGRLIDDCYYFPLVIENINTLAGVINEATGGTFQSDKGIGFILGFLSIMDDDNNENDETKINLMDDKSFENEDLLQRKESAKVIITEVMIIYKRTLLLKKHLQKKIK